MSVRHFWIKILIQHLLGHMPWGEKLYAFLQNRILNSVTPDPDTLARKTAVATRYCQWIQAQQPDQPDLSRLSPALDIGAGWFPIIPLYLYQQGINRQLLADIRPLLRHDSLPELAAHLGVKLPPVPDGQLFDALGWTYQAPATHPYGVADGSLGLVVSTETLNYPPRAQVRAIHQDVARMLRPGGYYAATVQLIDFYALNHALPKFHYLRFSQKSWNRWIDNRFTPLNRMRAADHRALFQDLPFECLEWQTTGPTSDDLEQLRLSRPHAEWRYLPDEELAVTQVSWLMRRLP